MVIKDYLIDKPILNTDNLILRPITVNDISDLEEWLPDSELYTYWGRSANKNELEPKLRFDDPRPNIKRKPNPDFVWGIVLKSNMKVIGEIYVINIENNRMAKVAYRVSKQYWGKGFTTEALKCVVEFSFEETELQKLWTDVDTRNIASCRVLEKCGFMREGMIRQGKMNLTFCDYYLYGLLRDDYYGK
ncbi:MAG: acetyltransferase family [Anaerocolumna sp.]|jgi:ribosomal-protein-alanine N-acetyltransferase|nr:acetyltransferase family [Anaerocolumna sp.]